ncbi:MAG: transposase, partial [Chloroflexota bacterium]|nr:transposase [Chloroflexota bacterium]
PDGGGRAEAWDRATHRVAPTDMPRGPASGSLGAILAQFKSVTTKRVNQLRGTPGTPLWQRNYFDKIVWDERSLNHFRDYIEANPFQWALDEDNPSRAG